MDLSPRCPGPRAGADTTLSIGDFARLSGLTPKALRLYDASGLLRPATTVPESGYRLYRSDQLERARRIALLRGLDMPLTRVAEVLAGDDESTLRSLRRWWNERRRTQEQQEATLAYLLQRLDRVDGRPPLSRAVEQRTVSAAKVAVLRREVDQPALVSAMIAAEQRLRDHLESSGSRPRAGSTVLYHGIISPENSGTIEVCVAFDGPADPVDDIVIRVDPEHDQLFCSIPREDCFYPRIIEAYDLVHAAVAEAGLMESGSPREIYLSNFDAAGPAELCVEIAQPVTALPGGGR
jgi:DNA-binding transcriptional MerR regulator